MIQVKLIRLVELVLIGRWLHYKRHLALLWVALSLEWNLPISLLYINRLKRLLVLTIPSC